MKKTRSEELYNEAQTLFPGGVHSPVRAFKSVDGSPIFMQSGDGCRITDVDGNSYIDFCCSWGPLILGHNHPDIRRAIEETISNGTSFGTPTALGNEIGKLIINNHSFLEKIRFVSSGTEAVMSAIRLARGFTSKNKIIKFEGCYHGHVDSLLVKTGSGLATFGIASSAGIPPSFSEETIVLPLNDLQQCIDTLKSNDDIAAVIIEPIPANNGLLIQDRNFLEWLRKICDDNNILLIFDEVISGFRVGFEGASGYYAIEPDLLTFGKIIGGGMPVGAFGGRSDIMDHIAPLGNVYQAGTLSANPVTLSAGIATLNALLQEGFYESLEEKTEYFVRLIQDFCQEHKLNIRIQHIASIFWLSFENKRIIKSTDISGESNQLFSRLHSLLLEKGIYFGPSAYEVGFISSAHRKEDLKEAADKINSSLLEILS